MVMKRKYSNKNRNEKQKYYMQLLNSREWWGEARVRQMQAHPLCQMCEKEGYVTAAVDVHHLKPVLRGETKEEMRRLCYDPDNLISLCVDCHIAIHKQMKSHTGQMMKLLPKDVTPETEKMADFASRIMGRKIDPDTIARPKKGIMKSRFGWTTKEEYKELTEKQQTDWVARMQQRFMGNGHQDTTGEASVDAATED